MTGKLLTEPQDIAQLLAEVHKIAVLGASRNPARPSHKVFVYLREHGYDAIPVNPGGGEIDGVPMTRRLEEITGGVDVLEVFRNPKDLDPAIVDQALALGARALWLQDGVVRQDIADKAVAAGLTVVMDDCIKRRLKGAEGTPEVSPGT